MSLLKKGLNRIRRTGRETRQRAARIAAAVAGMKPEQEYTLHLKDGRSMTLTGEQWKQLEQARVASTE